MSAHAHGQPGAGGPLPSHPGVVGVAVSGRRKRSRSPRPHGTLPEPLLSVPAAYVTDEVWAERVAARRLRTDTLETELLHRRNHTWYEGAEEAMSRPRAPTPSTMRLDLAKLTEAHMAAALAIAAAGKAEHAADTAKLSATSARKLAVEAKKIVDDAWETLV